MTDTQPADVSDLLTDADRTARGLLTGDAESDAMLEHAEAAAELLESADPETVLEAVGLETLPDGSEPSSIPEAIARGDEERVDELRRLLHLANLADGDRGDEADESDDSADGTATDELEASVAAVQETGADERVAADDGGDADVGEETDESRDRTTADGTDGAEGDETAADDADSTLESAVRSTLEAVDADFDGLRDRLEAAATSDDGDASAGGADDESTAGDDKSTAEGDKSTARDDEEMAANETGAETADDEPADDDGLLGTDLDPDVGGESGIGSGPSSGRGVARHSTVAASPSDRPDMRGLARFSTMPKRE